MDRVQATPDAFQPEPTAPATGSRPRAARTHALRAVLIDMVAPVAVYYCTRAAGGGVWLALAGSAVVPAVTVLAGVIGRRRTDASALLPVTFIALPVVTNIYVARSGLWQILRDGELPRSHPEIHAVTLTR